MQDSSLTVVSWMRREEFKHIQFLCDYKWLLPESESQFTTLDFMYQWTDVTLPAIYSQLLLDKQ